MSIDRNETGKSRGGINSYLAIFGIAALLGVSAWFIGRSDVVISPATAGEVTVYKSASCGCCGKWVDYMRKIGYNVVTHDTEQLSEYKKSVGVPEALMSCHTATIGGYVIEGHVPAREIARLLKEKPAATGLSVPGMVSGSPGMENGMVEKYDVILFGGKAADSVYASY